MLAACFFSDLLMFCLSVDVIFCVCHRYDEPACPFRTSIEKFRKFGWICDRDQKNTLLITTNGICGLNFGMPFQGEFGLMTMVPGRCPWLERFSPSGCSI